MELPWAALLRQPLYGIQNQRADCSSTRSYGLNPKYLNKLLHPPLAKPTSVPCNSKNTHSLDTSGAQWDPPPKKKQEPSATKTVGMQLIGPDALVHRVGDSPVASKFVQLVLALGLM